MNRAAPIALPASAPIDADSLREFHILADIARKEAGLVIPQEKAPMVFARITKRLRALGISDRATYCELVSTKKGAEERRNLISTLTTNVTSFFRESHHFETLVSKIIPSLQKKAQENQPIRIWSAGCSSGQEPYSIAMTILEHLPNASLHDIKILATDIDPNVIQEARHGRYTESQLATVPLEFRKQYFKQTKALSGAITSFEIKDCVKNLIAFRELNLLGPWPFRGSFDTIFCRNVVIYFDRESQNSLWPRFQNHTKMGGYLFLGHSERLDETSLGEFRPCGTTTYRREALNTGRKD